MTQSKPIIGVTGNSGSGKGAISTILRDMGGFYLDADNLAHKVMEYGQPAYNEVLEMFGPNVLTPDKSLDRKKIGDIVFRNPDKRKALEQIVHAHVVNEFEMLTTSANDKAEYTFIIWDAPLLAEAGMHIKCDFVLLVTAPYSTKLSRIIKRDNITDEHAKLRLSSQPSDEDLYTRLTADIGEALVTIIENTGTLEDLEDKTRKVLSARC